MEGNKKSIIPGVLLIVVGLLLLLSRLDLLQFNWGHLYPLLLMALGLLCFLTIRRRKDAGAVFPGTIFFLLGLFFFLRNYDLIYYLYPDEIWPIFLIIFGLAFIALYLFKPQDWGVLIPGSLLLFFGIVFFLRELDLIYWRTQEYIERFWPLILIVIGTGIVLSSLTRKTEKSE
ncbi:MAG: DUF5668 domain-containing protein [candidate division KSB1 bacterium]|nr:DUF5668 domain-containing protein [candidate division KSB1 bacterium]